MDQPIAQGRSHEERQPTSAIEVLVATLSAERGQLHAWRLARLAMRERESEPQTPPPPGELLSGCRAKRGPYHTLHSCEPPCTDHQNGSPRNN